MNLNLLKSQDRKLDMARYKRIPLKYSQQSSLKRFTLIFSRMSMFVLCLGFLSALMSSGISGIAFWLLAPLLIFFGSVALHNIALLGHEGTHFTLSADRYTSALIGTLCSAVVPLHFNTGFAVTHAIHHWHANTDNDPDLKIFSEFKNFFSRLFLARSKASRKYLMDTIELARGNMNYRNQVGIKDELLFKLARINLVASGVMLAIYATAIFFYPGTFGASFVSIYVFAVLLSSLRPYMEHVGTDSGAYSNSRTFSNTLLDFTFGTINLHLAHHMYPQVPAYNLPSLNRWLLENEFVPSEEAIVERSTLSLLRVIASGSYGRS